MMVIFGLGNCVESLLGKQEVVYGATFSNLPEAEGVNSSQCKSIFLNLHQ